MHAFPPSIFDVGFYGTIQKRQVVYVSSVSTMMVRGREDLEYVQRQWLFRNGPVQASQRATYVQFQKVMDVISKDAWYKSQKTISNRHLNWWVTVFWDGWRHNLLIWYVPSF